MKRKTYFTFLLITILISSTLHLSAQDTLNGTVKYQKIAKFNFELTENERWNDYISSLPTEANFAYVLYFSNEAAFFEENPNEQQALDPKLQGALMRQNYWRTPIPELKKVFYNIKDNKKLELFEFMSRTFLVKSEMDVKGWRLSNQRSKILDYICMSAELMIDDQKIVAWFTPQIPVSLGPAEFFGLPGLILAVEKNEETLFLATSVEITPVQDPQLDNPIEGKKLSQKQFSRIVEDKIKEVKENQASFKGRHKR